MVFGKRDKLLNDPRYFKEYSRAIAREEKLFIRRKARSEVKKQFPKSRKSKPLGKRFKKFMNSRIGFG